MKKLIIILAIFISPLVVGCTDSGNAHRVLSAQGYTNIKITGYSLFGCSKDEKKHTGFTAVAPNGQRVEGVVCEGLFFKGATIRIL